MAKITRKSIIETIILSEIIINTLANDLNCSTDEITNVLNKWNNALNKVSSSNTKEKAENEKMITEQIVPFILSADAPVTAKTINDEFIHNNRTNKASAILRRAIEMGLISRDRVRKNANYEYAAPDFDWNAYISAYDEKVAKKAAERIAKARSNRK